MRRIFLTAFLLFGIVWLVLLQWRLTEPTAITFSSDAGQYNGAAYHLSQSAFYSFDGVRPFMHREPGQSLFIALAYILFGAENRAAYYGMLFLLYAAGALLYCREIYASFGSRRAATIMLVFLFALPPVYHVLFSYAREGLALTLMLFFAAFFLQTYRTRSFLSATAAGLFLGFLIMTYVPFLFLPIFLLIPAIFWKMRCSHIALMFALAGLVILPWAARNVRVAGGLCLTGCGRESFQWHARGEQAEHVRGLEPFKCLLAEYVTRDWTGRSEYCSLNAIMHRQWPHGLTGTQADIDAGEEGKRKILAHFPSYLWFSVFEVLELHLPYVNGWGGPYNMLTASGMLLLYAGCLAALRTLWDKRVVLVLAIMAYTIGVFALTDATPRYLVPVLFAYATLAGIGYDRLLTRLWNRPSVS